MRVRFQYAALHVRLQFIEAALHMCGCALAVMTTVV